MILNGSCHEVSYPERMIIAKERVSKYQTYQNDCGENDQVSHTSGTEDEVEIFMLSILGLYACSSESLDGA